MASVEKVREGVYTAKIYLGIDPVSKKPRHKRTARFRAKDDDAAKAKANRLEKQFASEKRVRGTTAVTLGELLDDWYASVKLTLAQGTRESYEGNIKRAAPLKDISLAKLTVRNLESLYRKLMEDGLSTATVRKVHNRIAQALDMAVRYDLIDRNVARMAQPPPVVGKPTRPPSVEELVKLLDACSDVNARAFLVMTVVTGARAGELGALRWRDIDFDNLTMHIARSLTKDEDGKVAIKDTKTHEARTIPIAPETAELLKFQRERALGAAETCEVDLSGSSFVFSPSPGSERPYRGSSLTQRFMRLRDKLDMKDIRLHDMRHFSITQMSDAGIDMKTVSTMHGHSRLGTTARYTHRVGTHEREAAQVVADILTRRSGVVPEPSEG